MLNTPDLTVKAKIADPLLNMETVYANTPGLV